MQNEDSINSYLSIEFNDDEKYATKYNKFYYISNLIDLDLNIEFLTIMKNNIVKLKLFNKDNINYIFIKQDDRLYFLDM